MSSLNAIKLTSWGIVVALVVAGEIWLSLAPIVETAKYWAWVLVFDPERPAGGANE